MKRLENVKRILFVSLGALGGLAFGEAPLPMACGHYLGKGFVERNSNGQYLLVLKKGSASPLELILLGGSIKERKERLGTEAVIDFYVPRSISSNNEPYIFVKGFTKVAQKFPTDGLIKTRRDACGLKKYAP